MSGEERQGDLGAAASDWASVQPEVDEELHFHIEMLTEQLIEGGLSVEEARKEAQRRFGDPDRIAVECKVQQSGLLGMVLGLLTLPTRSWSVRVAPLLLVLLSGGIMLGIFVHLAVSLAVASCAVLACLRPEWSYRLVQAGRTYLVLLCLMILETFLLSRGDWVHSLWSIQLPLSGLLLGSGLLLVTTSKDGCTPHARTGGRPVAAAFLTVIALGLLPLLLTVLPFDERERALAAGSVPAALVDVFRHGFGGDLPTAMFPASSHDLLKGIGIPPRIITITMAATWFAAVHWILFGLIALLAPLVRHPGRRRVVLLLGPVIAAAGAFTPLRSRALYMGIWRNEEWFVLSFGPVLLGAGVVALLLGVALTRARIRS